MDPYAVLGVPPHARAEDLRAAYRTAVRRWHPDRDSSPAAAARFGAAQAAWELVGDPVRRAAHDAKVGSADVIFVRSSRRARTARLARRAGRRIALGVPGLRRRGSRELQ